MRLERARSDMAKGWYVGPWNSELAVSIGYANEGVNEPHTFLPSPPDYFHFVVHLPGMEGEQARTEKHPVPPARLGLE